MKDIKHQFASLVKSSSRNLAEKRQEVARIVQNAMVSNKFSFNAYLELAGLEASYHTLGFTPEYVSSDEFDSLSEEDIVSSINDVLKDCMQRITTHSRIGATAVDMACVNGITTLHEVLSSFLMRR